ncbi:MAG: hypothetical protein A2149_03925 [Candidatus Schekmanbacteria bacterium RBG_16_38_11]|uniref:PilZ domain-containing protein n=1 Tax=Candidatus Schekmanbacteria bacterium RBG_16_38_11 TaxID=1817880 RepID=A0A1F7RTS1_9BACT|nr:MAG: hypothetical protein A2149_03925 [Candidatus Schekmanbacteria bacterium RBG_16_38_11]
METNQRKTKRTTAHIPLRYWIVRDRDREKVSAVVQAISHDISEGGIRIRSDRVPLEDSLKITKNIIAMEIDLFPHFKNIKVFGEPVWCDGVRNNEKQEYHIGIKFLEAENGHYKVLQRYLESRSHE